jgi:DivIVA domain-containing protein
MSLMPGAGPRLMPGEVQSAAFRNARLGRRGLDEEQVREFCDQVGAELVSLISERAALQEEVRRLRRRVLGRAGDDGAPADGLADAHFQAVGMLFRAQQTADHYVAEAEEYCRHLAQYARRRRDEILAQARSYADGVLEEAHREASQAAESALAGSVLVGSGVGPGIGAVVGAAGPALAAPAGGLCTRERAAAAELAYLQTFSEVYRSHLRSYLDALLRNADEREPADKVPADKVPVAAGRSDVGY